MFPLLKLSEKINLNLWVQVNNYNSILLEELQLRYLVRRSKYLQIAIDDAHASLGYIKAGLIGGG